MSKRKKKGKQKQSLSGIDQVLQNPYAVTIKDGLLMLVTAIAAGGAGAALGKHSLLAGVPLTMVGIHKKNGYIIAAGIGLTLSNGYNNPLNQSTQGVEGFDVKQIAEQAKSRVGTFFENFKEKLYISPKSPGTSGLEGEEQVTYFVNPYSNKELDMSAIDRVQEQIAQMQSPTSGLDDIEREF
jgi:hypothetical protein